MSRKDESLITSMTSEAGEATADRQSVADVLAAVYEDLYRRRDDQNATSNDLSSNNRTPKLTSPNDGGTTNIPPITDKELDKALDGLKNRRCRDTNGLGAEMLKSGGQTLRQHLLRLYNEILQPHASPPQQWKQTTMTVIHKPGDPKPPCNHRPISIVPLLYKLLSEILYNRLAPLLDTHQTPDQAGFRHDYSTEDHLYTMTLLQEKSHEWQLGFWVATIDFRKAFDSVDKRSHSKTYPSHTSNS